MGRDEDLELRPSLGDGNAPTIRRAPAAIAGLSSIAHVGAGVNHSVAVTANGVVFSWGKNDDSQLGDGADWPRHAPSPISEPAYEWRVATPMLSIAPKTYETDQTVVVTVDTPGATIHYTQNGAEPTESDPEVASGASVVVSSTQTLKAKAFKAGRPPSLAASASYTMKVGYPSVFPPTTQTYTTSQPVTFTTVTPGATLYYTVDGTTPTTSSSQYTSPITVATTTPFKVIGVKSGWSTSDVRPATYTMNFGTLSAPVLSTGTGTYEGSATVTISAQPGATIRYTTTGSTPNSNSTVYNGALTFSSTKTLKAVAFQQDYTPSPVTAATYTIRTQTPVLSTSSGSYAPGTAVTITSPDLAATLRVTLTGLDPTTSDAVIASGTTLLVGNFTLKVRAFKAGLVDSTVAAATYTLTAPLTTGVMSAGDAHTVLATPGGLLYAWGENASGRLGDGTTTDRPTPKLISTLTGVTTIAAGLSHTLAVTWDGRLFAWGNNGSGRLGIGSSPSSSSSPALVTLLTNVVDVAAGDTHSLALTADGSVYAWGLGSSGRLGLGSTNSYSEPQLVSGLPTIVKIAAGGSHSLAVTSAGQLYAWGANSFSQLGDGTPDNKPSPTLIWTPGAVRDVVGGSLHTVAIMDDGTVFAWGAGTNGQLGLGDTNPRNVPTVVPGLTATDLTAGKNHNLALRTNGTLASWGANGTGQLGYATPNPETVPTTVDGPSAVAVVSAGGSHTAAVTPDGHLWTWGDRLSGRLGDGSTTPARPTPADVFTVDGLWGRTAAPLLSHSTGTYNTTLTVNVTHASPQAVLRYTTTGAAPTESDALVPTNGEISIDQTRMLRVRAWSADRPPSAVVTANYTLQPAIPTITPSSGAYGTPQTVTVTLEHTTPSATLRYTLDGSEPSESSTAYTAAFGVSTTTTVKARVFRTGWSASQIATGAFVFNFGQLATPTATPGGGLDGEVTPITLTASAGATIRYTVDGTDPTVASSLYTGPLTFGEGTTTLKARAFQADWTPSAVMTETYTLDLTPPTITASVWPAANAAGWHNTDVTITFACDDANGIADCPAPVVVNQDGEGQVIIRTATDAVGHQANVTIIINLDRTPGEVSVTAPVDGTTTNAGNIALSAQVTDALSGITNATCNGTNAPISNGQVECTVPLSPGRNTVVLFVRDAAGNGISSGVTVTRVGSASTLRIDPATRTLAVGEFERLTAMDDYGVIAGSATWSSNDTNVVIVDAEGIITAVAPGEVMVTAVAGGLEATAAITVFSAGSLPFGAAQWTVEPMDGFAMQAPIYTHRIDDTVPHMFAVESDAGGTTIVRGVSNTGTSLWTAASPGVPIMGDSFGGIIAELRDEDGHSRGLARFAAPAAALPWRYESAGTLKAPAQAPDGTIYVIESVTALGIGGFPVFDKYIVVIDGATGQQRARIAVPRNTYSCVTLDESPGVGQPAVGMDGYAYVAVTQLTRTPSNCSESSQVHNILELLRVGPAGESSSRIVYEFQGAYAACNWVPTVGNIVPDDLGGVILKWVRQAHLLYWCSPDAWESNLTRFDKNGARSDYQLPHPQSSIRLVSDDGTIYLLNPGQPLAAIDVRTWTTKWTSDTAGIPVAPLLGGGVALQAQDGTIQTKDETGATTSSTSTAELMMDAAVRGMDTVVGVVGDIVGSFFFPTIRQAAFGFYALVGNDQRQGAPSIYEGYGSNHSSIVLSTAVSPEQIFDQYLRTFAGVNAGDVGVITAADGFPVTGVGQRLTFTLNFPLNWIPGPFQIEVSRYDAAARTLAAHTVPPEHPLEGYRYWRVFQLEPGRVVVETGTVDLPATPSDIPGFIVDKWVLGTQLSMWEQYLYHIRDALGASSLVHPYCSHPAGRWDFPKDYLLLNIHGPGTDRVCR